MTRKDYILIANAMRKSRPETNDIKRYQWAVIVSSLCEVFEVENSNFDVKKFKKACGFGEQP